MPARLLYALIASALLLSGCKTAPMAQGAVALQTPDCPGGGICFVTVKVNNCATGDIVADPDVLPVPKGLNDPNIRWSFDRASEDAGYRFAENGVKFKSETARTQFSGPGRTADGKKFMWTDSNSDSETYYYELRIVKGKTACAVKDPAVANGR